MHLGLEVLEAFHHSNKMHDYTQKLLLVASSCCQVATAIIRSRNNDAFPAMPFPDHMDTCDFPVSNDIMSQKDGVDSDANAPPSWVGSEQSPLLFSALDLPEESNTWNSRSADILDPATTIGDRHVHTRTETSPNGLLMGPMKMGGQLEWQKILGGSSAAAAYPSRHNSNVGRPIGKQQLLWTS